MVAKLVRCGDDRHPKELQGAAALPDCVARVTSTRRAPTAPSVLFGMLVRRPCSAARAALIASRDSGRLELDGKGGFIQQMTKASLERGLQAELSGHLDYDKGDPVGRFLPNARNGPYPNTLGTFADDVELAVPRVREGTFTPACGSRVPAGPDAWMT